MATQSGAAYVDEEKAAEEADSSPSHTPIKYDPRFEVSFTGEDDPRSPRSISTLRKWLIVCIVSSSSLSVACTSSLYTTTYSQIEPYFHISDIEATLGLTIFAVGLGLSPMILAPLSEVCVCSTPVLASD